MPHEALTISQEAYDALKERKRDHESFSDVILRLTGKKARATTLLDVLHRGEANEDLADAVDAVYARRHALGLRY